MPKHTIGVIIMGFFAIIMFAGVAMCGAKLNPRIVFANKAKKTLHVTVERAEADGARLEIEADAEDSGRRFLARDVARLAYAVYSEERNDYKVKKRHFSSFRVSLNGGEPKTFGNKEVRQHSYYNSILDTVRSRLAEQLGLPSAENLEVREQAEGFGVWVLDSPADREPGNQARLVASFTSYRFRFVTVVPAGGGAPATFAASDLAKRRRR